MQDHGLRQRPAVWAAAALFAARVLDDQPQAGVLIHCSAGRRRSAMLAYAVLRLRGHDRARAAMGMVTNLECLFGTLLVDTIIYAEDGNRVLSTVPRELLVATP